MQFIVNAFFLVAAYRIVFILERRGATILGVITGIVLAASTWLFSPGPMRFLDFLVVAGIEIAVLAPSFYLCARRDGVLVAVVNVAVGSAAALLLPIFAPGWLGR
jgi:hypothetical protein